MLCLPSLGGNRVGIFKEAIEALRVFGWRFAIVLVLFYEFVIFLLAVFCSFA